MDNKNFYLKPSRLVIVITIAFFYITLSVYFNFYNTYEKNYSSIYKMLLTIGALYWGITSIKLFLNMLLNKPLIVITNDQVITKRSILKKSIAIKDITNVEIKKSFRYYYIFITCQNNKKKSFTLIYENEINSGLDEIENSIKEKISKK